MALPTKEQVYEVLKPIHDPEIRIGVVDLGLIYDVAVNEDGKVQVKMTLTTPACPYGEMLLAMVRRAVEDLDDVKEVDVVLVWDPPWNPEEMASDTAKDLLGIW